MDYYMYTRLYKKDYPPMHQLSENRLEFVFRSLSSSVVGVEASFTPTTDELSPPQPRVEIGKNPATRGILLPVNKAARVTNALRACSGLGRCSGSVMEFLVVAPDRQPVTVMTIGGDFALSFIYNLFLKEALIENLTKTTYPSGKVIDYVYDNNDRLTNLKVNTVTLSNYTYDLLDRRATKDLMGTATQRSTYTFDAANQLSNLLNAIVGGANISQYGYTYDNVGNRLTMTAPNGTHTYTYNNIEELMTVTGAQTHNFAYDKVANRTTVDGVAYTKNNLNQYTQVGTALYAYDNNGNLTTDGVNTYTYDEENRLATFSKAGTTASYTYDAFNRRVSKTVNGTTTYFVYDGDEDIEERASTGTLSADYVYGNSLDEVLTMTRGGTTHYYQYDGLGSVTQLTNGAGATVESYNYDVYGQPSIASTIGNPFFFTGRRLDSESGIYYYRARMYDPKIGRFLQRDPIGYYDHMNLYQYVGNDPINYIDPFGLYWLKDLSDFSAGFGDTMTFGATWWLRDQWGDNKSVDPCSGWYKGGEYSAYALDFATGKEFFSGWKWMKNTKGFEKAWSKNFRTGWHKLPEGNYWGSGKNLPHYHRRPGIGKHRPWEGGF